MCENSKNIRNYTQRAFKDIFSEDKLKEYLEDIEEKCAQNGGCSLMYSGEGLARGYDWFYCSENLAYSCEQEKKVDTNLKEENELKCEQRTNAYNSDEKNLKSGISENNLIDQIDQIDQIVQIWEEIQGVIELI